MRAEVEVHRDNGGRLVGELRVDGRERHSLIGVLELVCLIERGRGAALSDRRRGAGQSR